MNTATLPPEEAWLSLSERRRLEQDRAEGARQAQAEFDRHYERLALVRQARARRVRHSPEIRAQLKKLSGPLFGLGPSAPHGSPVTWAWLQWLGTYVYMADWTSTNYQQHITARPREVLLLPTEVCTLLLAQAPTLWSIQTVVPIDRSPIHNSTTGVDEIVMNSNGPWGVDSNGTAYFEDLGAPNSPGWHLYIDVSGTPYLSND